MAKEWQDKKTGKCRREKRARCHPKNLWGNKYPKGGGMFLLLGNEEGGGPVVTEKKNVSRIGDLREKKNRGGSDASYVRHNRTKNRKWGFRKKKKGPSPGIAALNNDSPLLWEKSFRKEE